MTVQGELAGLESERAAKLAELSASRAKVKSRYQQAVADAIAQNEIELARALYEEPCAWTTATPSRTRSCSRRSTPRAQGYGYTAIPAGPRRARPARAPAARPRPGGGDSGSSAAPAQAPLSAYEQTYIKAAAKTGDAAKLNVIQTALSNGSISAQQAAELRSRLGLGSTAAASSAAKPSGGGGGRVTAVTK